MSEINTEYLQRIQKNSLRSSTMTDSSEIMVKQEFLEELKSILKKTVPNAKILAYGSRVNGSAHAGSDLDIAVKGDGDIAALKAALENSNIPFLVDVVQFDNLPDSFKKEILKNFVEL